MKTLPCGATLGCAFCLFIIFMNPKTSLTRRKFIKQSAAIGASTLVLPQIVRAAGKGTAAPGNRIVMGAIGVGGQGGRHVVGGIWTPEGGLVSRADVQMVAVCDVNANRVNDMRNQVNARYGNQDCKAYQDFRELLARPDIDAVLIATGDRWHPYISMEAARAGKDVYCEKPISVTIEESLAMRREVRRYGTVFQMGTQQRSSYHFRFACELVRNGYIGEVKEVVVGVGGSAGTYDCRLPAQPVPIGLITICGLARRLGVLIMRLMSAAGWVFVISPAAK